MKRGILVNFHLYTNFGREFYSPILDFFLTQMQKYENEYDCLYLLDSNWKINPHEIEGMKAVIIQTDPNMRYYNCYKEVLPQIKEDLVLLMDNDMIVHKDTKINETFHFIDPNMLWVNEGHIGKKGPLLGTYDVISIMDTIGTWKTDKLKLGNKFCPYFFATRKDVLMKYLNIEWGPEMPEFETFGRLTKEMVDDGIKVYELPEDKSEKIDYGYNHIRSGSTPAYLLATKHYGNPDTYWEYLKNQPKEEILRQCRWYTLMGGDPEEIINDL